MINESSSGDAGEIVATDLGAEGVDRNLRHAGIGHRGQLFGGESGVADARAKRDDQILLRLRRERRRVEDVALGLVLVGEGAQRIDGVVQAVDEQVGVVGERTRLRVLELRRVCCQRALVALQRGEQCTTAANRRAQTVDQRIRRFAVVLR